MDDPVLHRKIFRANALKTGALKPKGYVLGAGPLGITGTSVNPYYTTESQGQQLREFVKGGVRYVVDQTGNIVRKDYLPAVVKEKTDLRPTKGISGTVYKGLEAVFDPESAYKRGTYGQIAEALKPTGGYLSEKAKSIGSTLINPETYTKTIPQGIMKGIKTAGPGIAGFVGADYLAEATGNEKIKQAVGTGSAVSGGAELAAALGLRGIPYAGAALNLAGGPARLLMNPYVGIPVGLAATTAYGLKKRNEYLAANPEAFARAEENRMNFNEMSGFTPEVTPSNTMPITTGGTPTPPGIDDFSQVGGPPSGGNVPPGGGNAGGTGITDMSQYGGLQKPIQTPLGPVSALGDFENKIADGAEKTAKASGAAKPEVAAKKAPQELSWTDKIGNFARTASGNAFMLKFAAGLLSGKGSFGEVVGKALDPAVSLMAEIDLKEQEFANKQFLELMKAQKTKNFETGSFPIVDAKSGEQRNVQAFQDKDSKQVYIAGKDANGNTTMQPVSVDQTNLFSQKSAELKPGLEEAYTSYGSVATGLGILGYIKKVSDSNLGSAGATRDLGNTILGIGKGVKDSFSTVKPKFTDDSGNPLEGKALKQAEEKWAAIDKKSAEIFANMDADTIKELGKLKVSETTLKYFLANAFKDKDRLTNTDLQLVADLTDIITFKKGSEQVRANLDALDSVLREKQRQLKQKIHKFGVTDAEFASNFYNTPGAVVAAGLGYATAQPSNKVDFSKMTSADREKILKNYF
jgi:hypothetical protein